MRHILRKFFSMKAMAITMLIFALSIAIATFIENYFDTFTAHTTVYSATWLELLLVYLVLILIYNMICFKMYKHIFSMKTLLHFSFLAIFLGAVFSRYMGYEGTLYIREGESKNSIISTNSYLTINLHKDNNKTIIDSSQQKILFSKFSSNTFFKKFNLDKHNIYVKLLKYLPNSTYEIKENMVNGSPIIKLFTSNGKNNEEIILKQGEIYDTGFEIISFGNIKRYETDKKIVHIYIKDKRLYFDYPNQIATLNSSTNERNFLNSALKFPINKQILYFTKNINFTLLQFENLGIKKLISKTKQVSNKEKDIYKDALKMEVSIDNKSKKIIIFGKHNKINRKTSISINGITVTLEFGAKYIYLPFFIKLKKFNLKRYPGSNSASSYSSEVFLIDKERKIEKNYLISMNNVLNYRGFRFFQASYDTDEKGTILLVNYDFWGTMVTYIGYTLLILGLFGAFFTRKGHFQILKKELQKLQNEYKNKDLISFFAIIIFFTLISNTSMYAQTLDQNMTKFLGVANKNHAKLFGQILTQTKDGRLEPLDSLNLKLIKKIYKQTIFKTLNANQLILAMMLRPNAWQNIPIINIKNREIINILRLPPQTNYASINDFYPHSLSDIYVLKHYVADTIKKPTLNYNKFDNDLLKVNESVHIIKMIFSFSLFKIIPKINDVNHKWYTLNRLFSKSNYEKNNPLPYLEREQVRVLFLKYFNALNEAINNNESEKWQKVDDYLKNIINYQKKYASKIYPKDYKINLEIIYNKIDIFQKLLYPYLAIGIILLILSLITINNKRYLVQYINKIFFYLLISLFIIYTIGLIFRWIISMHAPWSNGYEAIIYVGWSTSLAGFMLCKRLPLALAGTSILTGITLLVAMYSNFNPRITTLVPVLNSYWLTLHVSMITASYGFLGLAALLGLISLILFTLLTTHNTKQISNIIKELNIIAEMTILLGLAMLTVGNFLGAIWANESWGRYWGWDAKETWSLVSILVYATVAHIRYIPNLYTNFRYSIIIIISYSSILMTFFGVNFYFSGLHSYAKGGEDIIFPSWVYYYIVAILFLISTASFKKKLFTK